jgi:putative oxidoreductase
MNGYKDGAALIGRIALALIFIASGFDKLMGFDGTVGYIKGQGVPLPEVAAAIAVVIELGGGLAILAGWMTRWAALALIVFLIVISPIFHNFWSMSGEDRMINQIMFMKNLSILGGFLVLYAFGPGRYSIDKA